MTTYGDVREWKAGELSTASSGLRSDLRTLEGARDDLDARAIPESWRGLTRIQAQIRKTGLVNSMGEHIDGVRTFERAIFAAHGRVEALSHQVTDLDTDARGQEFEIGSDGTVTDVSSPGMFQSERAAEAHTERRTAQRDALVRRVEAILEQATEIDSTLVQARPETSFSEEALEDVVIDPVVARQWGEMSDAERRETLERIAEQLAEEGGVEDFEVRFEDLEDQDGDGVDDDPSTDAHGSWSDDDRVLRLDLNDVGDPDIINTVAHEVRHAVQNQAVEDLDDDGFTPPPGADRGDVEDWRENFDDYKTPEDDGFDAYHDQPVEADARNAGDEYLEGLTPGQLERLREEG